MIELQEDTDLFGTSAAGGITIDRTMLAAGLYANLKDISLDEFVSLFVNRVDSIVDYVELYKGANVGQRISLLFNPHRLSTSTKACSVSLYEALKDERFSKGLSRVMLLKKGQGSRTEGLLYAATAGIGGLNNVSWIQEFPPHVARNLALEYNLTKSSRVLDPCAGWGGRMIGFSTSVDSYTCCEPSSRTVSGLCKLREWLRVFRPSFTATIHEAPFEDINFPPASFDFALTSPPYYDTERYTNESTNSFNRYKTFEAWCDGFYAPLIHRTMAALKPGAAFVINIGSRVYPLNERLINIARDNYIVEKQKSRLSASNGLGKDGEGETFYEIRNPAGTIILLTSRAETIPSNMSAGWCVTDAGLGATTVAEQKSATQDVAEPGAAPSPISALDFAFRGEAIAASLLEPEPAKEAQALVVEPALTEPGQPSEHSAPILLSFPDGASAFNAELERRGHRLLTCDGRFFVSEASRLTDSDRIGIKALREELIALATPWTLTPVIGGIGQEARPVQSIAQFFGRSNVDWRPDEPPDLTGADEVVLNFATDGLDWAGGNRPVGVTVSTLDGQLTRFLPFGFKGGGNLDEVAIKRWATEQLRGKRIVNANTRFDVHMAREWGVDLEEQGCTVSDVMHYAALLDDHRKQFALDALVKDYLPEEQGIERVDEKNHAGYAAWDVAERERYTAQVTAKLRHALWPLLDKEELQQVRQLEDDVIFPVVEMEKNGVLIDVELNERWHQECNAKHGELMREVYDEVGFAFDHTANGWQRLFEQCGVPPSDSYAEGVITAIDHPLIKKAYFAAQIASLNSKTFGAYRRQVDSDGILRYDINQLRGDDGGTVSGRFSIGYVQQVPNHDNHFAVFDDAWFPRRVFISKTGKHLAADAAQIEYRILAHLAGNERILQAYRDDPWTSFHKMTWEMIKQYKPDMPYSHQKSFNFARQYGARLVKLAMMMKFITEKEGEEIRTAKRWHDPRLSQIREIEAAYAKMMPEGDRLLDRASHLAKLKCDSYCRRGDALHRQYPHRGYVKTALGRRSRFPHNYKTYIGLNRVIQGTAADVMKQKLVELHRERRQTGLLMRFTVHDHVGGDAQEGTLQKVSEILNRQSFNFKVPILWECAEGANWAEAK